MSRVDFRRGTASLSLLLALSCAGSVRAEQLTLRQGLNGYTGTEDTSLYQDRPDNTNGGGVHLFAGITAQSQARRALIRFDLTGAMPAGSTIQQATLRLTVNRGREGDTTNTLSRLVADWGEGNVDAGEPGGLGASAMPGDATWVQSFHQQTSWAQNGGDYAAAQTMAVVGEAVGSVATFTSAAMAVDVQFWLENPAQNFGWLIRGNESSLQNARRYSSSEAQSAESPTLTIEYTTPQAAADISWHFYD